MSMYQDATVAYSKTADLENSFCVSESLFLILMR
jgi:hypothetical protein